MYTLDWTRKEATAWYSIEYNAFLVQLEFRHQKSIWNLFLGTEALKLDSLNVGGGAREGDSESCRDEHKKTINDFEMTYETRMENSNQIEPTEPNDLV